MKSLLPLVGGGAIVAVWKSLHPAVKVAAIFAAGMLAAVELNKDANESLFSGQIFGGQGAQGNAQIVDPAATKKAIETGQPVTGAAATFAAQYQGLNADAKQKAAYADAASESEDEIIAKLKAGQRITSTEQLRLIELQTARQEFLAKKAQAEQAQLGVKVLKPLVQPNPNSSGHDLADEAFTREWNKIFNQ